MLMTEKQIADAVTDVLKHYGALVTAVQGTQENNRKTIGAISVQFHDDGQYSFAFGGVFQRGTALGALLDATLHLRDVMTAQKAEEEIGAYFEAMNLNPSDLN